MAKVQINDLDAAAALDGTELVEIEQAGESAQCTTQDIADLAGGALLTVENKDNNFTANGASGTVYTNLGAAGNISVALEGSPIGTQYTFAAVQAGTIEVAPFAGHTIKFNDALTEATITVPGDGSFIENGDFGSFTILKLTATVWTVTAGWAQANG